jgi:hypothetical protein
MAGPARTAGTVGGQVVARRVRRADHGRPQGTNPVAAQGIERLQHAAGRVASIETAEEDEHVAHRGHARRQRDTGRGELGPQQREARAEHQAGRCGHAGGVAARGVVVRGSNPAAHRPHGRDRPGLSIASKRVAQG